MLKKRFIDFYCGYRVIILCMCLIDDTFVKCFAFNHRVELIPMLLIILFDEVSKLLRHFCNFVCVEVINWNFLFIVEGLYVELKMESPWNHLFIFEIINQSLYTCGLLEFLLLYELIWVITGFFNFWNHHTNK